MLLFRQFKPALTAVGLVAAWWLVSTLWYGAPHFGRALRQALCQFICPPPRKEDRP